MRNLDSKSAQLVLRWLTVLLIIKVTVSVILKYHDYFPANFDSDFLRGRERYFFGSYQWAFYPHIAAGPVTLLLGLLLLSERFRKRFPIWHRSLGRVQVICVLLVVAPSGLWMARHATTGSIAGTGFTLLAVATGTCVTLGWRAAVHRRFAEHRRWMWRCFLLLCSAVVLRLIGGLATVTSVDAAWIDSLSAWISWLAPVAAFELYGLRSRSARRHVP